MNEYQELIKKIKELFEKNGCLSIYEHSINVAKEALRISKLSSLSSEMTNKVVIASLLHDIGGIYPIKQRIEVARKYSIELLDEELAFPLIIHQKLSRNLAKSLFNIEDEAILNAIECHTTLKANYTKIDLIVFLADKIAWDQKSQPPYLKALFQCLDHSLEEAALYYIDYLLNYDIKVIHPWLMEAKDELESGRG